MRQTLKQQHIKSNDIANLIFDAARCDLLTKPLQGDPQFITGSSSIDAMINYLQKNEYISFINCHIILEKLVSEYGKEDITLQNSLQSYQEKFKQFCEIP